MNAATLSIVIPAYNESQRIGATLARIRDHFADSDARYEVIVVDDGSVDGTAEAARNHADSVRGLRVLCNEVNRGKGFSVRRGMLAASGAYRLFMDADNSVDISHVDSFMNALTEGADVVIGSIHTGASDVREHNGIHRRILGKAANVAVRLFAVPGIHDTQRGFKLFSATAADEVFRVQTIERFGFDIEALLIARNRGFAIQELPVVWNNPAGSTVTAASYVQTFIERMPITINRMIGRYSPDVVALRRAHT